MEAINGRLSQELTINDEEILIQEREKTETRLSEISEYLTYLIAET